MSNQTAQEVSTSLVDEIKEQFNDAQSFSELMESASTWTVDLVNTHGEAVVDLFYLIVRLGVAFELLLGAGFAIAAGVLWKQARKCWDTANKLKEERREVQFGLSVVRAEFPMQALSVVLHFPVVGFAIAAAGRILDPWNYVKLWDPVIGIVGEQIYKFLF